MQAQLPHLSQEEVVPINLVMHPRGKHTRYNFSWPLQTLATVVILSTADRMQIASMVEWANAASTSTDGNCKLLSHQLANGSQSLILAPVSTIQFYTRGQSSHKYYETADAIGKKLEFDGILAELEKKVPLFHGLEEDDDGTICWATIKATLALEAGASAVGGPPTRPMPPSTPGAESKRQTLPMRPIPPPASRGKSTCQTPAQIVPRYHPSSEQKFYFSVSNLALDLMTDSRHSSLPRQSSSRANAPPGEARTSIMTRKSTRRRRRRGG